MFTKQKQVICLPAIEIPIVKNCPFDIWKLIIDKLLNLRKPLWFSIDCEHLHIVLKLGRNVPWRHGMLQTECCVKNLLARSSSTWGSLDLRHTSSWLVCWTDQEVVLQEAVQMQTLDVSMLCFFRNPKDIFLNLYRCIHFGKNCLFDILAIPFVNWCRPYAFCRLLSPLCNLSKSDKAILGKLWGQVEKGIPLATVFLWHSSQIGGALYRIQRTATRGGKSKNLLEQKYLSRGEAVEIPPSRLTQ